MKVSWTQVLADRLILSSYRISELLAGKICIQKQFARNSSEQRFNCEINDHTLLFPRYRLIFLPPKGKKIKIKI